MLGLELMSFVEGNRVSFRVGSSVLLCFNEEVTKNKTAIPPDYGTGDIHFAFEVDAVDCEGSEQEIIAAGIEIEQKVDWGMGMRSFYFRNPDNNLEGIVQVGFWERLIAAA